MGEPKMAKENGNTGETQLVVFDLASEYYGVDIGDVREIIRMQNVTRVPGTPVYMEGVINLRGKVVPVVDLRKRLDLKVRQQTKESRIVVVDIGGKDVGVIVDGVTEVLRIPLSSVEPPSQMIANSDSAYIRGIAKLGDKLVILLDLDKVLATTGYDALSNLKADDFALENIGGAKGKKPSLSGV
jgi:purine-binding chemotaxis protein CheW